MFGIEKRLQKWVEAGLLSTSQVDAILQHEAQSHSRNWVAYGVAGIGVTAIAVGIISVIAANWGMIPPLTKLFTYFILQIALGVGFWIFSQKQGVAREAFLTLFALAFLGGIGLVGQIYNLHSDSWRALLFWNALTLGAVWIVESQLLLEFWFLGLCLAGSSWADSYSGDQELRWIMSYGLSFFVFAFGLLEKRAEWIPKRLRKTALRWGIGVSVVLGSVIGAIAWRDSYHAIAPGAQWKVLVPFIGAVFVILAMYARNYSSQVKVSTAVLVMLVATFITLPIFFPVKDEKLLGCLFFLVIWAVASAIAVFSNRKRLFDFATLVIGIRLVVVYFEVFGSLAATGTGLIISGAVILGILFVWYRYRGWWQR